MTEEEKKRKRQKERFLELMPKKRYNISKVCGIIGIHRNTVLSWRKKDNEFLEAFNEMQERKLDDSEETLYLISQGIPKLETDEDTGVKRLIGWEVRPHFGALMAQLQAQGKGRGYGNHLIIEDNRDEDERDKTDEEILAELTKIQNRYKGYDNNQND